MPDLSPARPQPSLTEPDTGPFWTATRDHRLTYQVCQSCGRSVFFPRLHCPYCGSSHLVEKVSSGEGVLYTYTVIRQHTDPFFRSLLPYAVGMVDLDEGFRMMAPVLAPDPGAIEVGRRVHLEWEDHTDWSLPTFRLSS
jgi:uncharacterized protein